MQRANIFDEALGGLGRWFVAIPPFLIVGFLATGFVVTGAGQERLHEANQRLQVVTSQERAVDELDGGLYKAQSGLRGYLLTGDEQYLKSSRQGVAELGPRLERLSLAYAGSESNQSSVNALRGLIVRQQSELGAALEASQGAVHPRALAYFKTSGDERNTNEIAALIDILRNRVTQEHASAAEKWRSATSFSRWITVFGTIFNLLLVGIATRLVYMDLRRRTAQTAALLEQKIQLERDVEERTHELVELSTQMQSVAEREKANLARELHDELGGLLVGARMDLSWAEQHLTGTDVDLKHRLNRVQQSLAAGIDLKRRIIEELRPTLLDNVGLFAALRWQLKETCGRTGIKCIESYPEEEPQFTSEASIALFRIAQEAFTNILKHAAAKTVSLTLDTDDDVLMMRIGDDGIGIPTARFGTIGSHGLASMRHRVRALGGKFDVTCPTAGGTVLLVRLPLAKALRRATAPVLVPR